MNDANNTPLLETSSSLDDDGDGDDDDDGKGDVLNSESSPALQTVADLAHEFLLFITTKPGTGVCFQDAGWYKSNRFKSSNASGGVGGIAASATTELDGYSHGDRTKSFQVYNTTLLKFLGILSPSDDDRQRALTLAILTACPELVQP